LGRSERHALIKAIEQQRGSRLLTYITGDRRGLETKIAMDVFPFIFEHLSKMGHQEKIDLFLYTTGGITMVGYGLVNLIREFCDSFNVIVPYKALSCGTLIVLGANEVTVTKMGVLSPIDPSIDSPLGPVVPVPGQPGISMTVPVNVEDAISYIDLAKHEAGLKEDESLGKIFDRLSTGVHPLVLGAVNRSREQIRFLAKTLLSYHMDNREKIEKIADIITKERFSHDYLIGRREAKEVLGLNVIDVSSSLDQNVASLFREYDRLLEMSTPYNPEVVLGASDTATGQFDRCIIESNDLTHVYRTRKVIRRVEVMTPGMPIPVIGYQERVLSEAWVEDNSV
jgi:hypothetical protein